MSNEIDITKLKELGVTEQWDFTAKTRTLVLAATGEVLLKEHYDELPFTYVERRLLMSQEEVAMYRKGKRE